MERKLNNDQIVDYYKKSSVGYALFHSKQGSIHMALSTDGRFSEEGYYRAPKLAWEHIDGKLPVNRVLELGCGSGFNLEVISRSNPSVDFLGIDLTPRHVTNARKKLGDYHNVEVSAGDFQNLEYPAGFFGGAYSIESFCHATDPQAAFATLRKALRVGAPFVVIDAWRTDLTQASSQSLLAALSLTERSMAVSKTMLQSEWLGLAEKSGFELERRLELSTEVMPNLERFESMAQRFMSHPRLARFAGQTLKLRLLENVIAGYLMAESVRSGYHTYDALVLKAV
jgi:SAM-dependent methyltransferase